MKKLAFKVLLVSTAMMTMLTSCKTKVDISVYSNVNAPQEAGVIFTRVTPENAVVIWGNKLGNYLAINPDGTKIAFLSRTDNDDNIFTFDLSNPTISQQRTYRNNTSVGFVFSSNGEDILFNSDNDILSTNANAGAICKQITTGNNPESSIDGKYIFFQRVYNNKSTIWRYDTNTKELATLCPGCVPSPSKNGPNIYLLTPAKYKDRAFFEIRRFNYETGTDEVIFSNHNINPRKVFESPDGKWLLFAGSRYGKKDWEAIQLFVVRTDGTDLTQLTYHPAGSKSPQWSKDGKKIYFISGRGNKDQKYGIWSMNFTLY